jgi:Icc-related predicted phosphoesterase
MSDLHLEFENRSICDPEWNRTCGLREAMPGHPKQGPYLGDLVADAQGVDLVVLAGDIALGADGMVYADEVARFVNAPVVYVMGNHEGYRGSNIDDLADKMRRLAAETEGRVHFLENAVARFGDVAVLGATLWTDYAANGTKDDDIAHAMNAALNSLNDHRKCRLRGRPFTPDAARGLHETSRKWLDKTISGICIAELQARIVVVTHHAPILDANPPEYRGGHLAPAFVSDMRAEIEAWKPELWVFGHTHHNVDLAVGKTRVVSQQRGYVGVEPGAAAFRPKLVDLDALTLDDAPTGPKI